MNWLRRLLAPDPRNDSRGTLTLLDGSVVLGWPGAARPTPVEAEHLYAILAEWASTGMKRPIALPFPVDVTDLRGQTYERTK